MFNKQLKKYRKQNKFTQQELASKLGIPRSTLSNYEQGYSEPDLAMVKKMAKTLDLSVDDLLSSKSRNQGPKVLTVSVDENNKPGIDIVETKAAAGYIESFQDPEYIQVLPKIQLPMLSGQYYRAFEIEGDSMLPLESGTIIVAKYTEKLEDMKMGHSYIVVSKRDGVVYKRVFESKSQKRLLLQSDNNLFPPYEIDKSDIQEIWEYQAHIAFQDGKNTFETILDDRIRDIQEKVTDLHERIEFK